MLTEKEWLFINEIIQEIYKSKTLSGLGEIFLLLFRKLIPFKAAELTLVDSSTTNSTLRWVYLKMTSGSTMRSM